MNSPAPSQTCCDYCGLPVQTKKPETTDNTPLFCCLGCRVAAQISGPVEDRDQSRWTMIKIGLAVFFSMNVMVYTLALWSADVYAISGEIKAGLLYELYRYVCLIFTVPVLILLGGPLFETTYEELGNKKVSTNLLLALGVLAAFVYSAISVFRGSGQVYFEIVCMVLVAVTIGRWLEATGKRQTTDLLRGLQKLLPDQVRILIDGKEEMVPLADVRAGDLFRVLPGERIAVDGQITHSLGAIDEQMVTGEAVPAVKEVGDEVFSGTLNLDGNLTIRASSSADSGALERIVQSVLAASAQKDRYGKLADRVMVFFIPVVLGIAGVTFAAHVYLGQPEQGMLSALSVALIACPCALALAVPLAIWTMLGRAAREQVLLHNTDVIPTLAAARTICIDKTGTLTESQSYAASIVCAEDTPRDELLRVAATIAATSTHPISHVVREAVSNGDGEYHVQSSRTMAGRGIAATLQNQRGEVFTAYLGSPRLMEENSLQMPDQLAQAMENAVQQGRSIVCLGWQQSVRAIFVVQETLRADAQDALEQLRRQGFRLVMLTGDHQRRAEFLAGELSLEAYGELLPADKVDMVRRLSKESGPVVMVGDGINDAPALAAADVGIALGAGSDLSRETADLCLLGNQLAKIPWTIDLARATRRTIRWNLWWALSYNTLGIAIAAAGWLNPIIAALAMVVSSLLVVSNSLRLAHWTNQPADELAKDVPPLDAKPPYAEPVSYPL